MTAPFRVALSGDFRKADNSPVYPDFDLAPLKSAPGVEMEFLQPADPIRADQVAEFDALILLTSRFQRARLAAFSFARSITWPTHFINQVKCRTRFRQSPRGFTR